MVEIEMREENQREKMREMEGKRGKRYEGKEEIERES